MGIIFSCCVQKALSAAIIILFLLAVYAKFISCLFTHLISLLLALLLAISTESSEI